VQAISGALIRSRLNTVAGSKRGELRLRCMLCSGRACRPGSVANGKVKVDPQYNPQLLALADKAKTVDGYMIEVKGYASSVGSVSLNQQLSEDRADAVTNILVQQGHIPLTRMLAPGAMGESHQVGNDKTAEGQAENRRVLVRVLQNKGIAGI